MPLSALAAVALAASPTWSLVITRRVGIDPVKAAELAEQLQQALAATNGAPLGTLVPMAMDATACSGAAACVANLGKTAGVDRVVALQLLKLGSEVAVDATLLEVNGAAPLGAVTAQVPAGNPKKKLGEIAAKLAAKAPIPVAPLPDPEPAPVAPPPEPPPTPAPAVSAAIEAPTPALRYASYGLGGGAVVSAGVALALGVVALQQGSAVKNTDADFLPRRGGALGLAMGADVCWSLAAAFAVGAVVTFLLGLE